MNPKITVLMAMYNGGQYLEQSIKSVLNQTFTDFEFLIVNDCSTDESVSVIESFNDPRIRLVHNENNIGQTRTLNEGLKLAQGEFIARIDADDLAFPQWLERQLKYLENHDENAVVSANAVVIDENNIQRKFFKVPQQKTDIILRSLVASPLNHVGSIMKKQSILDVGGYDENYVTAADYDLWGKLARNNIEMTSSGEVLMAIRVHASSLSRSSGERELEEITSIMRKNINYFTNENYSEDIVRSICDVNYTAKEFPNERWNKVFSDWDEMATKVRLNGKEQGAHSAWFVHMKEKMYLKYIFMLIERGNVRRVRELSNEGMKFFSRKFLFIILYLSSFFGAWFLKLIPKSFSFFQKLKTDILSSKLKKVELA